MICRLVLILALCATWSLRAQTAPAAPARPLTLGGELTMDSNTNEIDERTKEFVLRGNARVSDGVVLILADEIRYSHETKLANATGHIVFTRGNVRLLADRLTYNRVDGSFTAENIRLGRHPYFIEGFSASGTRDEITVKRARASYGEPGPWQPTINADTIVFAPEKEEIHSENLTVGIGHVQPFPIPRFDHKFSAPLILGTGSLNAGYRRSLGVFAEAALHVPLSPNLRLGADVGIYTDRGIMVGPSGRYSNFKEPDKLNGFFRSGYINDHGDRGVGISGLIPEHRAYAEWQHRQEIGDHLTLTASANWWKDSEVYRDFRSRDFFRVQEPDTFAEGVYTGENYFTSLFTRLQPNQFHRVQKRLPELRFDLLPAPIGHGFINRFNASAAMLREDQPFRSPFGPWAEVYRTVRLDAYYGIERPIVPRDWLAITPVAGGRITHYTDSRIDRTRLPDYTRTLGEVGADVVLRAAGTFDYKNPQWKIDGLRHLVTPRLGYRYIPRAEKGERQIIPIDRRATIDGYYEWSPLNYLPYLQPLGLGDMRNVDQLQSRNTLRVSLDNILQTRDTKEGTRDLVSLNVGTDFHFAQQRYQNNGTETHVEIALTPAPWLQFDAYQSYAPDSARTEEFNSGITLRDARAWSVRFSNNYLRGQIEDYMIDGRRRINERLEALVRLRYDTRKHRFNEQSYGIVQNLGNTWLVSYMVSVYEGRTRESSFGFNIQIDTVRF